MNFSNNDTIRFACGTHISNVNKIQSVSYFMFYTNKHCYYDTSVNYRFTRIRWYTARVVVDCEFFRHYIEKVEK